MDDRAAFKQFILEHGERANAIREQFAKEVVDIVASEGNKVLNGAAIGRIAPRLTEVFDRYYAPDGIMDRFIHSETREGRALAFKQSNAIIEDILADEPELLEKTRLVP